MKKFFVLFLITNVFVVYHSQIYSGGDGSISNPYLISNLNDLKYLSENKKDWNKNFKQTADIDLSDSKSWNSGNGFIPIGNPVNYFYGTYDGGLKKIISLNINNNILVNAGLFGYISTTSKLKNIILEGGEVNARQWVGSLVGESYGEILNCKSSCIVSGEKYVGGLIGMSSDKFQTITNCSASGKVTGWYTSENIGGLVGVSKSSIDNCSFSGDVSGKDKVGGLIGSSFAQISNCNSSGNVNGDLYVGGLVGLNNNNILNSYSNSNVTGYFAGGLVGDMGSFSISNCYATGDIIGKNSTVYIGGPKCGGLAAFFGPYGLIGTSFFCGKVSGTIAGGLIGELRSGIGLTTITNCFARTTISSSASGLIGQVSSNLRITNSYAALINTSGREFGGLFSQLNSNVVLNNTYWDSELSGEVNASYNSSSMNSYGKNTSQMKTQSTFQNWDFLNIWAINPLINNGYPYLSKNMGNLNTEEINKNIFIKIFPTSTKDILYINSKTKIYKYSIYSYNGKLIKESDINSKNVQLNLHYLLLGIYIIKLETSMGIISKRIFKN